MAAYQGNTQHGGIVEALRRLFGAKERRFEAVYYVPAVRPEWLD